MPSYEVYSSMRYTVVRLVHHPLTHCVKSSKYFGVGVSFILANVEFKRRKEKEGKVDVPYVSLEHDDDDDDRCACPGVGGRVGGFYFTPPSLALRQHDAATLGTYARLYRNCRGLFKVSRTALLHLTKAV